MQTVWNGIKSAISTVVSWFSNTAWPILKAPIGYISSAFSSLRDTISGVFATIRSIISSAWSFITDKINAIRDAVNGVTGVIGNFNPFGRAMPSGVSLYGGEVLAQTARSRSWSSGGTSTAAVAPVVVNINTGIGDPVAIAREVRQVFRASSLRVGV